MELGTEFESNFIRNLDLTVLNQTTDLLESRDGMSHGCFKPDNLILFLCKAPLNEVSFLY